MQTSLTVQSLEFEYFILYQIDVKLYVFKQKNKSLLQTKLVNHSVRYNHVSIVFLSLCETVPVDIMFL